ncbi:MAG: hypothetical protein U0324_13375 [Polyangiales bacterium]
MTSRAPAPTALALTVLGFVTLAPASAWAQRVEVTVAAPAPAADALDRSLAELFERVALEGRVTRALRVRRGDVRADGAAPDVVARVWVDATRPDRCVVIVADPRADRVLVRRVPLARGFDEIAREAVAHIVQDTVDALRRGQRIGAPRDEAVAAVDDDPPPQPPPPPPPPRGEPSRAGPSVALGWAVGPWAEPLRAAHGPELTARWWVDRRGRFAVHLDAGARLPLAWEDGPVALTLVPLMARAGVDYGRALGPRWSLGASVGFGVDAVLVTPRAAAGNALPDAATVDVRPAARARVEAGLALGRGVSVGAAVLADVDLTATDYYVERGAARDRVASPWRVRPAVVLSVGWDGRGR